MIITTKLLTVLLAILVSTSVIAAKKPMSNSDLSYIFGYMSAKNYQQRKIEVNAKDYSQGFKDASAAKTGRFSTEQMQAALAAFNVKRTHVSAAKLIEESEKNVKISEQFFAKNKTKSGVKTLPSGLQYKIITQGKGNIPKRSDTVAISVMSKTINGTVLVDSTQEKKPLVVSLSKTIPGWREALTRMQEGSTWEVFVPPHLLYNKPKGSSKLPLSQALIFKLTLHSIEKQS